MHKRYCVIVFSVVVIHLFIVVDVLFCCVCYHLLAQFLSRSDNSVLCGIVTPSFSNPRGMS